MILVLFAEFPEASTKFTSRAIAVKIQIEKHQGPKSIRATFATKIRVRVTLTFRSTFCLRRSRACSSRRQRK